jgi:hypothetical protein
MRRLALFLLLLVVLASCGVGSPGSSKGKETAQASPVPPWVGIELQRGQEPRELVRIGLRGATIGPAGGPLAWQLFAEPRRASDAWYFLYTYAPFTRSTPEGEVVFRGRGKVKAGPVQQRMIFEWARQVAAEAAGSRAGAAYGLLTAWHQGGPSGICEDVVLYLTGEAVATACGWEQEIRGRLDPEQLGRVYEWFDRLQPFQIAGGRSEDARSGALETRVIFAGRGARLPTAAEQAEIRSFAASLFAELAARRRGGAPVPAQPGASESTAPEATPAPPTHLLLSPGAMAPRREEIILHLPEKPPPVPRGRPGEGRRAALQDRPVNPRDAGGAPRAPLSTARAAARSDQGWGGCCCPPPRSPLWVYR